MAAAVVSAATSTGHDESGLEKARLQIRVRFFAAHRERLGTDHLSVDLPDGATVQDLALALVVRFPDLGQVIDTARFAVNREYAARSTILHDGDEVALIPPVAGGRG